MPFQMNPTVTKLETLINDEAKDALTPFGCGRCLPCRINKSRLWAGRLVLESMTASDCCFVTLTYSDEAVPEGFNLDPDDLTLFLKRLRYNLDGRKVRYYAVGEYGDKSLRPHFHLALFGVGMVDVDVIEKSWNSPDENGFVQVGDLNEKSARYIVGYINKMWTRGYFPWEIYDRHPEFARMSRKPGLGKEAALIIASKIRGRKEPLKEVMFGKRKFALGRYLVETISDVLNLSDEKRREEFREYQAEIIEKYCNREVPFIDGYQAESAQKREQIKKKYKIYKSRRSI